MTAIIHLRHAGTASIFPAKYRSLRQNSQEDNPPNYSDLFVCWMKLPNNLNIGYSFWQKKWPPGGGGRPEESRKASWKCFGIANRQGYFYNVPLFLSFYHKKSSQVSVPWMCCDFERRCGRHRRINNRHSVACKFKITVQAWYNGRPGGLNTRFPGIHSY